jgi:putative OPT family oligopeptide transporter
MKLIAGSTHTAVTAGKSVFGMGTELGVALLGVGYIVGLRIAVLVFAGGLISWLFGIPIFMAVADDATVQAVTGGATGYAAAFAVWGTEVRYMGVGAMAVGGLWALVSLIKPIRDGVRSSLDAVKRAREGGALEVIRTERDTPINIVMWGTLALAVPIFVVFWFVVDKQALGISSGLHIATILAGVVFALLAGFLFSSVAGYMAGLVGSSNNPISGVTIATVLVISLILLGLLGSSIDFTPEAPQSLAAAAAAILVGGVVCCAAAIAGDNMQDLKAGQLVGATPIKQQTMQIVGVVAAAIALAPILSLLFNAYGLGNVLPRPDMNPAEALQAPQAGLMSSVAFGVLTGGLPWNMIAIGAVIAVAIIVADKILEARGSTFRMPVLAVAVGIYLPLELTVPIFIGGVIAHVASRALRTASPERRVTAERGGLLFSAGLITGEALMGIGLAVPFAIAQSQDVIAKHIPEGMRTSAAAAQWIAIALFIAATAWLYSVAKRRS